MIRNKRSPQTLNGSRGPVHDILAGVEQAVAGGWYPARRLLLSRLAGAARPQFAVWVPEADVMEGPSDISVSFALPGVNKADIRLQVTEEALTVGGRRHDEDETHESSRREMPSGEFLRRVPLPAEIKPESAKAVYRDGVLRVTLTRARVQAGRSVKIE